MGWGSAGSRDGGGEPPGEPGAWGAPEGSWGRPRPLPCLAMIAVGMCLLSQVAMNDLSPAGPIQAVEILMESPSLADMCRMHHAVIRRIQVRSAAAAGLCRWLQQTWPWGAGGDPKQAKTPGPKPGAAAGCSGRVSLAPPCGRPAWHGRASGRAGEGDHGGPCSLPEPQPQLWVFGPWSAGRYLLSAPGMGPGQFGS